MRRDAKIGSNSLRKQSANIKRKLAKRLRDRWRSDRLPAVKPTATLKPFDPRDFQ